MPQGRVEGQGKVEGEAGGFPLAPGVRLRSFGYPGRVTSGYKCWVMQCCAQLRKSALDSVTRCARNLLTNGVSLR